MLKSPALAPSVVYFGVSAWARRQGASPACVYEGAAGARLSRSFSVRRAAPSPPGSETPACRSRAASARSPPASARAEDPRPPRCCSRERASSAGAAGGRQALRAQVSSARGAGGGGRDQRPLQAPRRTTAARLGTASGVRGPLSKGTSRLPLTWASIPSLGVTRAFPEPVCVPAWRWGSTCQDSTWGGSGPKMLEKALRSGKEPEVLFQAALSP